MHNDENVCFKGAVSRDFRPLFLLIEPIWAPDKQATKVFLKKRFREVIPI